METDLYMAKEHRRRVLLCMRRQEKNPLAALPGYERILRQCASDESSSSGGQGVGSYAQCAPLGRTPATAQAVDTERNCRPGSSTDAPPLLPTVPLDVPAVVLDVPVVSAQEPASPVASQRRYEKTPPGECPKCWRQGKGFKLRGYKHRDGCPQARPRRDRAACPACARKAANKPQGGAQHLNDCPHAKKPRI